MNVGRIVGIYISESPRALPVEVQEASAKARKGLKGDRYFHRKGTYSAKEGNDRGRELTLIEQESLDYATEFCGVEVSAAEARRNIVTQGLSLNDLVNKQMRVGEVLLRGIRLCHPCAYLAELTGKPVLDALKKRGGLRVAILTDGCIRVGDEIFVEAI